jgi:hypothetical protein
MFHLVYQHSSQIPQYVQGAQESSAPFFILEQYPLFGTLHTTTHYIMLQCTHYKRLQNST